ncbi:MAG: Fic protein [Microgenomates group bacterium GW2011_GWA1_Microgenomates_45_10]|nr:MAG: Fic protein [Microgenomates group bacterium GW2011_GWA1_Microgenomates_45_10]
MPRASQIQQKIIDILLEEGALSSSDIHAALKRRGEDRSLVTIKRNLSGIVKEGVAIVSGAGPATSYTISPIGRLFADVDAKQYVATEPDKRYGLTRYNFELIPAMPNSLLSDREIETLEKATVEYHKRTLDLPPAIQKKELERLVIELSWKSSKIEGNTYTLLDTEKLILEGKEASGHPKSEATMILNHKDAFTFVHQHTKEFQNLTRDNLEEVHRVLVRDLGVRFGLRSKPVGVLGSIYQPLDNAYQIGEAVDNLSDAVSHMQTPYEKALIALLGISYIQPFEDGNKRTARLMANAILLAHNRAPLSYRSVDEEEYRATLLVFYELNSLMAFKRIFVSQYDFAARNYAAR